MLPDTGKTTIRHLHLVASQGDPLLLRLRAESQLGAASLTVPGLPPSAILLVRTLKTPPLNLQPSALLAPAWENSARASLTDLARRAARPINAPASPEAPAVLFADYAELLACLALDLAANRAAGCWWWRSFLGEVTLPAAFDAWLVHPREAPHALHLLEQRAQAVPFLRLAPPQTAEKLGIAILSAFNLAHLRFIFDENAPGASPAPPWIPAPEEITEPQLFSTDSSSPQLAPVERAFFAPEAIPAGFSRGHWILLNLARIIHFSPTALSSIISAEEFYEKALYIARNQNIAIQDNFSVPKSEKSFPEKRSSERKIALDPQPLENQAIAPAGATAQNIENIENLPLARLVETNYGGIFYLLNVAIALEIYGDFTKPLMNPSPTGRGAGVREPLSPWDFLALLGNEYIGEPFTKDPLWQLLADLAGRKGDDELAMRCTLLDGIVPEETIRARLLAAFAESDFEKLADMLFHEPARIFISSTRLDVAFSLEHHPIEIRMAGLDRDIGWLPAAGMEIYYHYE